MIKNTQTGNIKVGTIKSGSENMKLSNYETIKVMTASSKWGAIGPYVIKTYCDSNYPNGIIFENYWQFHKVYPTVPKSIQRYSQWDNTVTWDHPEEVHLKSTNNILTKSTSTDNMSSIITPEYFAWRHKGFLCPFPIRYPATRKFSKTCAFSFYNNKRIDYIEARKEIYLKRYREALNRQPVNMYTGKIQEFDFEKNSFPLNTIWALHPMYVDLKRKLEHGINLLIIEVDGPRLDYIEHFKKKYNLDIINPLDITEDNINILINDPICCFGHGYCLAAILLNLTVPDSF
jgi:hypothetical protein